MRSSRLATVLAVLIVLSSATAGVSVGPASGEVQRPGEIYADSVLENKDLIGRWSPSEDVVRYGSEGHPGWVVQYENGSKGSLEAWVNASSSREIRSRNADSNSMVVSAPPSDVGLGWSLFRSEPLRTESYVERIGVDFEIAVDPITRPELKNKEDWSVPKGGRVVTLGRAGSFEADGAAWGDEVNATTLEDVRQETGATDVSVNGSGIRVAILDTGLDYDSDLYGDRVVAGKNVITGEKLNTSLDAQNRSYDKVADGSSSNHGSWVATAIAGNGSSANATGIAPGAELVPIKVLGDDGSGSTSDIAEGLEFACEEADADVVSMSLGSPTESTQINTEIQECLEEDGVSAVVVAGGNNRLSTRYLQSPGDSSSVITVAATDTRSINESESAYFSAVGPDPETDVEPDVAAPGLKVTAEVQEGNRTLSGTSMATPVVSGVLALTLEERSALVGNSEDVRAAVEETAEPMSEAGSTEVGTGRINASNAVQDVTPNEDQDEIRSSDSEARDAANSALAGSIWRGGGLPLLSLPSIPIEARAAGTR